MVHVCLCIVILYIYNYIYLYLFIYSSVQSASLVALPPIQEYTVATNGTCPVNIVVHAHPYEVWNLCVVFACLWGCGFAFGNIEKACALSLVWLSLFSACFDPFCTWGCLSFWMTCFQLAVECALDERFSFASCCITGWGKQAPSWTLHPVRGWAVLHRCQPMELAPASDQICCKMTKDIFWHLYN